MTGSFKSFVYRLKAANWPKRRCAVGSRSRKKSKADWPSSEDLFLSGQHGGVKASSNRIGTREHGEPMSYPDVRLLDKEIECLLRDHNAIEIQRMGLSDNEYNRAALDFLNDQDDRILNLV